MIKIVILGLICLSTLSAIDSSKIKMEQDKDDFSSHARDVIGAGEQSVADGKAERGEYSTDMDNLLDVVIYYDTFEKYSNNVPYREGVTSSKKADTIALGTPLTNYMQEQRTIYAKEKNASKVSKKTTPAYFVGGECSVVTPVEISKSSEFTTFNCMLDFGGEYRRAEVFAGVYPDYEREILIALPIYASFSNGTRANFNGIVLRKNRGSINIADSVDSKRIRHLVAESALLTNDVAYRYATEYMSAVKYSNISTEITYHKTRDEDGNIISTPISSTKIKPPQLEDYFMAAGVELVSGFVGLIGKNYLYDTRPLFTMNREKRVHVEGVVVFDNQGLAKKFGTISSKELANSMNNNAQYQSRNISTAEKYTGAKKSVGFDATLSNAAVQSSQNNLINSQYGIISQGSK
ncbi:MAG: Unknown protein [uncultured Sulfurovum sp.]|uniref:Uncharacterized protein n=1 Tax=uncultured Sulfurovum sp. TaxID=269237 RepID=A0A6S6SAD0_9BACT|nr:MAG: Unknown protein [uncultured Sulfurovum sp.]